MLFVKQHLMKKYEIYLLLTKNIYTIKMENVVFSIFSLSFYIRFQFHALIFWETTMAGHTIE